MTTPSPRIIPRFATGLLLSTLLALSALLWLSSARQSDHILAFTLNQHLQAVGTLDQSLAFLSTNIQLSADHRNSITCLAPTPAQMQHARSTIASNAQRASKKWQFAYFKGPPPGAAAFGIPGAQYTLIAAPLWLFTLLSALAWWTWLNSLLRRLRWKRAGKCLGCGYDLRQSAGRCPECGLPTRP